MIQFISLMGLPMLGCFLMTMILCYLGLHVLKREIVFIDIAMAQIIAVASISFHVFVGVHDESMIGCVYIAASILVSSLFFSLVRSRNTGISLEAIIGVTYAIASALTLLIAGIAPGGHVHVEHILSGSILWISKSDIIKMLIVFIVAGIVLYVIRKPISSISNESTQNLPKSKIVWWDFTFYTLTGIVIAVTVKHCGVVLVFAFLIIPVTASAFFSSSWFIRYLIALIIGCLSTVTGLLFSNWLDFSAGPSVAFIMGIIILITGVYAANNRIHQSKKVKRAV